MHLRNDNSKRTIRVCMLGCTVVSLLREGPYNLRYVGHIPRIRHNICPSVINCDIPAVQLRLLLSWYIKWNTDLNFQKYDQICFTKLWDTIVNQSNDVYTFPPTTSMEQAPWEADGSSSKQQILHLLWNQNVHYRVHKSPPLDPILRKTDLVRIVKPYFPL
jgi:hypothetical protein